MAEHYLVTLFLAVALPLLMVAAKPALIFEYPYFMAAVFGVFILPQAYSLLRFPGGVSHQGIEDILLICILCLGCCVIGYELTPSFSIVRFFSKPIDPVRLYRVGVFFVLVSLAAILLIPQDKVAFANRGGLTGAATIFLFFGSLSLPGFAICFMAIRQKFTKARLFGLLLALLGPLYSVYAGRRESAVVFFLTIALTSYYTTRKPPSRALIFASLLFAMVGIPTTGAYRGLVSEGRVAEVSKLNLYQNFKDFVNEESILELRNAAALKESTDFQDKFGWGIAYWNQIVYRFVPAQIVGLKTKEFLMFGFKAEDIYNTKLKLNFEIAPGSTLTGMGDSYEQFGWFGCLVFALIGMLFRSIWTAALQPQAMFGQIFYIMICSSGMRAVTHQTVDFLPGVIYQAVFLGLAYLYARVPAQRPMKRQPLPDPGGSQPGQPGFRGSRWR